MICQFVGCESQSEMEWTFALTDMDVEITFYICEVHMDVVKGSAILDAAGWWPTEEEE